jgi:DNA-binding MarR family transcriptional regulator
VNISKNELNNAAASLPAFAEHVSALFPRLCRAMVRHESNHLTSGTITLPQLWALELIRETKSVAMHDLAETLHLKSPSATMLVDHLDELGLVRRTRGARDRRVVQVALSAKGRKVLDDILRQKKKGVMEIFKPLSAAERRSYLAILNKLASALSQPTDDE